VFKKLGKLSIDIRVCTTVTDPKQMAKFLVISIKKGSEVMVGTRGSVNLHLVESWAVFSDGASDVAGEYRAIFDIE
jgi:hypothetical protein